jgi:hypothetical protein
VALNKHYLRKFNKNGFLEMPYIQSLVSSTFEGKTTEALIASGIPRFYKFFDLKILFAT